MIIEPKTKISEREPKTRIKAIVFLVLLGLIISSCAIGIQSRSVVFTMLLAFACVCAIGLHILLTFFEFWKQHPWNRAFTPLMIFLIWVPAIFGVSKLRSDFENSQLSKYGVTTYGRVVDVFTESRGRYNRKHVLMAKVEFNAGQSVVLGQRDNKDHYMNVNDTVKILYASTDPAVFKVTGVKKWHPDLSQDQADQSYHAVLGTNVNLQQPVSKRDSPPQFKGGMEGFANYLRDNLEYPLEAQDKHTSGKVYLSFVIQEDGSIADVQVIKGLGDGCDEAAIKAIQNSPAWLPGIQDGKAVRVKYSLPISFSIR